MNRTVRWLSKIAILGLIAAASPAAEPARTNPAWERMKTLVGAWEGQEGSTPVSVTYTLVSNGTSLMESLNGEHDVNMVTLYAPDGDGIVATHYCAMGNQPRMRAKPSGDPRHVDFQFLDATNAGASSEMMRRLVVTLQDPDHFRQAWTSSANGQERTSEFVYTRKK